MIDWYISNFAAVVVASGLVSGVYTKSAAVVVEYKMEHGGQADSLVLEVTEELDKVTVILLSILYCLYLD